VETYRSRIKEKLQLRSSTELYLRAGQWVRENT
jgi:DNA-binding NarL/FixJ family response regulator